MKSKTIITIVIILLLAGAWYWTEAQQQKQELLEEFNAKALKHNTLLQEHDRIVANINTENNLELRLQKMKNYLDWASQHENTIANFKFYVEQNHESLRKAGLNPDYTRDNINTLLAIIQQNKANFQIVIANMEALQQLQQGQV